MQGPLNSEEIHKAEVLDVLDAEGLIRAIGRIQNAALPVHVKRPVLLPHGHRFTFLTVEAAHRRTLHGGVQDTVTEVRERYWVARCRQLVKKGLFRCTV